MALKPIVIETAYLTNSQISAMYRLMQKHYKNVDQFEFEDDLAEKKWTVLLIEAASGTIKGFSTQMVFEHCYGDDILLIFFSGDTIIDSNHWGSQVLPNTVARLMQQEHLKFPDKKLYWMLISKGFRTYRYLPAFFNSFYPRYDRQTPLWEIGLINSLGRRKFADQYNAHKGVVVPSGHSPSLKKEFATLSKAHQTNPHVQFFLQANPGFRLGEELVCIARFDEQNLKPHLFRRLRPVPFDQLEVEMLSTCA